MSRLISSHQAEEKKHQEAIDVCKEVINITRDSEQRLTLKFLNALLGVLVNNKREEETEKYNSFGEEKYFLIDKMIQYNQAILNHKIIDPDLTQAIDMVQRYIARYVPGRYSHTILEEAATKRGKKSTWRIGNEFLKKEEF